MEQWLLDLEAPLWDRVDRQTAARVAEQEMAIFWSAKGALGA